MKKCVFLSHFFLFTLSMSVSAWAADRLTQLTELLIPYAAGMAYLGQCDDFKVQLEHHPYYQQNVDLIVNAIALELKGLRTELSEESVSEHILDKRKVLAKKAVENIREFGCDSEYGNAARDHFEQHKDQMPSELADHINELN